MNIFTLVFVVAVVLSLLVQQWLSTRQISHIRARRDHVPDAFSDSIPLNAHQKAADYTIARTRLGRSELLYDHALLLLWTLGGGLASLMLSGARRAGGRSAPASR